MNALHGPYVSVLLYCAIQRALVYRSDEDVLQIGWSSA